MTTESTQNAESVLVQRSDLDELLWHIDRFGAFPATVEAAERLRLTLDKEAS